MGELLRRTVSSTAASADAESNDPLSLSNRSSSPLGTAVSRQSPTGNRKDIVCRTNHNHASNGSSIAAASEHDNDNDCYTDHPSTAPTPVAVGKTHLNIDATAAAAASSSSTTTTHLSKCTIVLAGQCLSFLLACSGAAQASLHLDCHLTAPTFAVGLFYGGLSLACLIPLYLKQRRMEHDQIISTMLASSSAAAVSSSLVDPQTILGGTLMIRDRRSPQGAYVRAVSSCASSLDDGDMMIVGRNMSMTGSSVNGNGHLQKGHDHHHNAPAVIRSGLPEDDEEPHPMVPDTNGMNGNKTKKAGTAEYGDYCAAAATESSSPEHNYYQHHPPHNYYTFACFRRLHAPWYAYAGMAVLDVYANYVTVLAFRYTTITSVTLLDALAIPTAMLLSRLILRSHYTSTHLMGVTLCLTGITINVLQDLHHDRNNSNNSSRADGSTMEDDEYPYKVVGDLLSMLGGILFGANKVFAEIAVKNSHDPDEYIGMQSLFAVIICAVQTAFTEMDDVIAFFGRGGNETCSVTTARWLLLGFVISNMIGYLGTARFLMYSEAAFFNLSLLTGDIWSAAFQIVDEHIWPASTFYLAAVLTLSGVLMYELASPEATATTATTTCTTTALGDGVETFANGGSHHHRVVDDDDNEHNTMTLELAPTNTHGTRARNGIPGMQDAVPIPIV